jgi:hypothetical protein
MQIETTLDRRPEQLSWDDALGAYEREKSAYDGVAAEYHAACADYDAAVADRSAEFAEYGLTRLAATYSRDHAMLRAEISIVMRDYKGRSERLTPEELGSVRAKAASVADAFLEWTATWSAERLKLDPAEKDHDAACDKLWNVRKMLLGTPAPDTQALLFKLDVLASLMAECDSEDAEPVALIRDDTRRLLGAA